MTDQNTQPTAARIIEWRPLRKNSLLGFARVGFPSGMVISDVTILSGDRGPWASPPSKPMLDRDGVAMKDQRGKIRYSPLIEFTSKEIRDRWSDTVIEALRSAHPEAFEE
jgi:DNA-binding cell septation regulator SpoVG